MRWHEPHERVADSRSSIRDLTREAVPDATDANAERSHAVPLRVDEYFSRGDEHVLGLPR
jgi:hypothetical protein